DCCRRQETARREARAHSHPPPGHGDLAEDEAVAALDEAHDALAHGAQRDETGDADRDPGDRERVPAKNSQHAAARTLRFTDSPRRRPRPVPSGAQTRLACGCGSYARVHRLASPAAAARTLRFTDSPRLRLRLVRSGSQTRLACGCGSYAPVHRLASPAGHACTLRFPALA